MSFHGVEDEEKGVELVADCNNEEERLIERETSEG
jgi:hypothetical protein